jgi:hypothetical protein
VTGKPAKAKTLDRIYRIDRIDRIDRIKKKDKDLPG